MKNKKGRFITFEGIDGSGKSTQIQLLKKRMENESLPCFITAEPSTGPIGSMLRQFLSGRMKTDEHTLAALFAADRLDHLLNETDGICAKINQGVHVICDRYILSSYAYQGSQVSLQWIMHLNAAALKTLRPDCHIFIDIEPKDAVKRIAKGRSHTELYETEERLEKIQHCYQSLQEHLNGQETIIPINGNQNQETIADNIWKKICPFFF